MKTTTIIALGAGVALVLVAAYVARRTGEAASEFASTKLNPLSDKNLAYEAANGVGAALTGQPAFNLGGWIHDKLNGDAFEKGTKIMEAELEQRRKLKELGWQGIDYGIEYGSGSTYGVSA